MGYLFHLFTDSLDCYMGNLKQNTTYIVLIEKYHMHSPHYISG
ncbi:hypothetical protein PROSTU_04775 [Providencia stuartii ATCC 25827]|uniref:Uncharacterized protein n=1 Tax=Providencia stuartii ATCC 25827 TaxID=471874 RepID=A0AA86YH57_PROST|nr:hypothetical protein PROSTU_04775 [Providencia stuartii ATCC 25827]